MTDRELMQQALEAMGTVGADWICEASHHAKKDQHKWGEPCPLQQRWHIAYQALRDRLAQPEQEPVAWMWRDGTVTSDPDRADGTWTPLYTTPPQRKPLTDEEIEDIWADCPADWDDKINVLTLARAIEAAHGIKEKNT